MRDWLIVQRRLGIALVLSMLVAVSSSGAVPAATLTSRDFQQSVTVAVERGTGTEITVKVTNNGPAKLGSAAGAGFLTQLIVFPQWLQAGNGFVAQNATLPAPWTGATPGCGANSICKPALMAVGESVAFSFSEVPADSTSANPGYCVPAGQSVQVEFVTTPAGGVPYAVKGFVPSGSCKQAQPTASSPSTGCDDAKGAVAAAEAELTTLKAALQEASDRALDALRSSNYAFDLLTNGKKALDTLGGKFAVGVTLGYADHGLSEATAILERSKYDFKVVHDYANILDERLGVLLKRLDKLRKTANDACAHRRTQGAFAPASGSAQPPATCLREALAAGRARGAVAADTEVYKVLDTNNLAAAATTSKAAADALRQLVSVLASHHGAARLLATLRSASAQASRAANDASKLALLARSVADAQSAANRRTTTTATALARCRKQHK